MAVLESSILVLVDLKTLENRKKERGNVKWAWSAGVK
jgi:hypothetical protein